MGSGSQPRIGIRLATLATAGAALATLTACAAPDQPDPQPGHPATLSSDVFAYDNPDFRTNRKDLLTRTAECGQLPKELQAQFGIKTSTTYDSSQQLSDGGCMLHDANGSDGPNQLSITIGVGTWDFAKFWRGDVKFTDTITTGGGPPGNAGFSGPATFQRLIIDNRYYAAMYVNPGAFGWDGCTLAVDTGSPDPLLVASSTGKLDSPAKPQDVKRVLDNDCPRTQDIARKLLTTLDPDGGSRKD